MKRAFLFSGGITAIVVGVFALAYLTSAATTKFPFKGEGTVQEHDFSGKNMRVYFTTMSERARALGLGTARDVSMGGAKIYKKDAKGKLQRVKQGNIAVGDRVLVQGSVKSDDRFVSSKVEWIDTAFVMIGKLRTFEIGNRRMTIDVSSSTYRPARYNGKVVSFIFSEATKFYTRGKGKELYDVTASDQKVRVEGKEVGTDLEVTSMNENIP